MQVDIKNTIDFGDGLTCEVEYGICTAKDVWENRNDWTEKVKNSREFWNMQKEDEKEAILSIVRRGVGKMYDRLDEWVPEAIQIENGKCLRVELVFLAADVEREIERQEKVTSFEISEAKEGLLETLAELGLDPDEESEL